MLQMKDCNDNVLSRMAETPLFANLSESERMSLATALNVRVKTCEPAELVVHECGSASEIVCVLAGRLHVYECGLKDGSRHLVHSLSPGEVYGASFPVLDLTTSPGMLVAAEVTRILVFKVDAVRQVMASGTHPKFVANLYASAVRQGFNAWRKLSLLSCYEIVDRVRLYHQWRDAENAAEPIRLSELAAYLGVNRTALYRAIDKLTRNDATKDLVKAHLKMR